MGKKREREERGRKRGQTDRSKKGKADSATVKSSAQDAEVNASPYLVGKFVGQMVVAVCPSISGRVVMPGLAAGQAWANPKKDKGHRCTACGNDVAVGHKVVREA